MNVAVHFENFISHYQCKGKILLAVSGGVDSMVLMDLCAKAQLDFLILHVNFQLRGEESERDEAVVRAAAEKYQVEIEVFRPDTTTYASQHKVSIQEAARNLRYAWFNERLKARKAQYIFTAHHADDNVETILFHFFRGTGLKGLTGIPVQNKFILRPLLEIRKNDLLEYAREGQLEWVHDSSNDATKYSRNFIRHRLLPEIRQLFPEVDETLLKNAKRLTVIHDYYQQHSSKDLKGIVEGSGREQKIAIRKLKKLPVALWHEVFHPFGFREVHFENIRSLCDGASGKLLQNGDWRIIKHGSWLLLGSQDQAMTVYSIDADSTEVEFEEGILRMSLHSYSGQLPVSPPTEVCIDTRAFEYPLVLRRWKSGDYFYPFGMKKKKKVARYLIDAKRSKLQKEQTWVLESDRRILWIVGERLDERCRMGAGTNSYLKVTYQNKVGTGGF